MLHLRFCVGPRSISEYYRKTLTVPFFTTFILKYLGVLKRSNLQTGTTECLMDLNVIFMRKISKLHYSAMLSSTDWRLLVVLEVILVLRVYNVWNLFKDELVQKRTNLLNRQTIQRSTKFLVITFFLQFLK